jgi:hypothetical protein
VTKDKGSKKKKTSQRTTKKVRLFGFVSHQQESSKQASKKREEEEQQQGELSSSVGEINRMYKSIGFYFSFFLFFFFWLFASVQSLKYEREKKKGGGLVFFLDQKALLSFDGDGGQLEFSRLFLLSGISVFAGGGIPLSNLSNELVEAFFHVNSCLG